MKRNSIFLMMILVAWLPAIPQQKIVYAWDFDQPDSSLRISGKGKHIPGVKGNGYKFDGYTSSIDYLGNGNLKLPKAFTLSAWIAMGAYPWNWAPIVTIGKYKITGFYFGVDSRGCLGFQVSDGTYVWHSCQSPLSGQPGLGMELHRWYHVAATYDVKEGMKIYIDGEEQGAYNDFDFPYGVQYSEVEKGFRIGMNREDLAPTDPVREWATWPSRYSFDGIMDEIVLYEGALSASQVKAICTSVKPAAAPQFEPRDFPKIPSSGRFGANYARMEYYPEWDNLWPPGDQLDVAVQFDESPIRVMFWRGTRYSPCWVSENNRWMADQSRETGYNWFLEEGDRDGRPTGCLEHMSDVQCRSSRVAIIENNDARVVVNWRYLQMDVMFKQKDLPDGSQFGEWGNELYYIYPDGVGIRHVLPGEGHWQESIFFSAAGTHPEDNVELEACTLINMEGESKSYTWEHGYPKFDLENANIQLVNFKSEYKPFLILQEGGGFLVFNGEIRPDYSHFPWWNHWPVAQVHSDGRSAYAPDRAAHSSLSWGLRYGDAAMYGMTNQSPGHLVKLARSWNYPAPLQITNDKFRFEQYDRTERAYKLDCLKGGKVLGVVLEGSAKTPVLNPVFVVNHWNPGALRLKIDGKEVPQGPEFRYGTEYGIDGTARTIIYIKLDARTARRIEFTSGS